ncbi:MAG: hypothetical protein ACFFDN_44500 [Candidatus Hodarchaeota archaeon]
MKRFVIRILDDFKKGENIDLALIVILVLIITILDLLDIADNELVSSITLATLGLIGIGLLITRYRIEDIYRVRDEENLIRFHKERLSLFREDLKSAKEIWMLGIILSTTTTNYFNDFKIWVSKGTKIRTLIVNMNVIDVEKIAQRFSRGGTAKHFLSSFDQTINQYKEISLEAKGDKDVRLKLINFIPPFSLYIFPSSNCDGIIYGEIYGYKSKDGSIPRFRITEYNLQWYKHYMSQFELMWNDAEEVDLSK